VLYALGATLALYPPVRSFAHFVLGPSEAILVIMSDAPLRDIRVVYDGKPAAFFPRFHGGYETARDAVFLVPGLRTRKWEVVLDVAWVLPSGTQRLQQTIRLSEPRFDCLYVLRIDREGVPVPDTRDMDNTPFLVDCDFR
jgi:hypothetical protein